MMVHQHVSFKIQNSHLGSIRHVADPDHTKSFVYFIITPTVLPDLLTQSPFSWVYSITSADVMSHITCRSYEPYYCTIYQLYIDSITSLHSMTAVTAVVFFRYIFSHVISCHVIDIPRWTHRILCDENSSMLIHVNASLLLDVLHGPGRWCQESWGWPGATWCHGCFATKPSGNNGEWLIMVING